MQTKLALIEKHIPACLTQGPDGRFYATEEGAQKLQALFLEHGISVTVKVNEFKRFEVIHQNPDTEVVLTSEK